jgi:heme exporter protein C
LEALKKLGILLFGLLVSAGIVLTFTAPNAKAFQNPELARIVFYHLPCAILSAILMTIAPYFGIRLLKTQKQIWDLRMTAAMELATLLGALTLITGIIFSKVQWGAWWNWDPRQSSYLMVMLMAMAFFAIRASLEGEKRSQYSSTYLMAMLLPIIFLIFIYPRLSVVQSLHPDVIKYGGFDREYTITLYTMFALIGGVVWWLYKLRVRVGLLEIEKDNPDAKLANRDHSATPRVVRPVPLSKPR